MLHYRGMLKYIMLQFLSRIRITNTFGHSQEGLVLGQQLKR